MHCMLNLRSCPLLPPADPHILVLSNFSKGAYRFTQDLLSLELASPALPSLPYPCSISSPLRPKAWERALQSLPDKAFTAFLMRGITMGFRIGVSRGAHFKQARRNLQSAYNCPDTISEYIRREVDLGRLAPLPPLPSLAPPLLQVSPFGAIPKKHRPNKWRLIVDLSSPEGHSINDAIQKNLCAVSYTSMDHAVVIARSLGRGCLLAKLDLKEAYRAVPIHPSDQRLLAVSWNGTTYIRPGRAFLRSLIDAASTVQDLDHWVHLNRAARSDLAWWHTFLHTWNGISIMPPTNPPLTLVSDASGLWGCGTVHKDLWFQLQWPESWASVTNAPKELVPIVVAVTLWGPYWAGQHIQIHFGRVWKFF